MSTEADDLQDPEHVSTLSPTQVEAIMFSANKRVQARFRALYGAELRRCYEEVARAHEQLRNLEQVPLETERAVTVHFFAHVTINAVLASLHHLVSGYPIAAGHMMRHYTEAVAMTLMCAVKEAGVYEVYHQDKRRFPVHKAPERLRKQQVRRALERSINLSFDAWEKVLHLAELYDKHSHVTQIALGHQMLLTEEGGLVLGSEFDPSKADLYETELRRRRTAATSFAQILPSVGKALAADLNPDNGGSAA